MAHVASASIIPGRQIRLGRPTDRTPARFIRPPVMDADRPAGDVALSTGRRTGRPARAQLCVSVAPQPPGQWPPGDVPSVGSVLLMARRWRPSLT